MITIDAFCCMILTKPFLYYHLGDICLAQLLHVIHTLFNKLVLFFCLPQHTVQCFQNSPYVQVTVSRNGLPTFSSYYFSIPSTKSLDASTTSICSYSYIIYVKYSCYARAVASSFCTMLLLGMLFHMMHKSWHIPCIECDYVSYVFL